MELLVDPAVIDSICPGMSYPDFADYADLDGVTCLTMVDDPDNINWVDKEQGTWLDKWGALQVKTEDAISLVSGPPTIESDESLDAYQIPDPSCSPVLGYLDALVARFKGHRAIAVVGESVFAPSQYLRSGLANLMMDYAMRPEFVKKLARIGVEYYVELYRMLIARGAEIVILGDDYAGKSGPFMSPAHFEEYILPGLTAVVQAIKDAGAYCIHHTDGDIWKILDMLMSTGVDMLGPLEPPYMLMDEVRRHSGGKVGVMGNINVDLLSRGTLDQIRTATCDLLGRMQPLGGHILSSSNTICCSVRGENYMAMLDAARTYGCDQPILSAPKETRA